MIYLTHTRLMRESEDYVHNHAGLGDGFTQRVCEQLLANKPRYDRWLNSHDRYMRTVARASQRQNQIVKLRSYAITQIHQAALVRHLRTNKITGEERNQVLREFYGPRDQACAAITEHKNYLRASCSQFCATELLSLSNDHHGIALIEDYERKYASYFSMYCARTCSEREGWWFLLESVMPDSKDDVNQLRRRITSGEKLPTPKFFLRLSD